MRRWLLILALVLCSGCRCLILGYASTPTVDLVGDYAPMRLLEGNAEDLKERPTVLFNHEMERPVGKVLRAYTDDGGLLVVIQIHDREVWRWVRQGVVSKLSARWRAIEAYPGYTPDGVWARILHKARMIEVSLVTIPANAEARILFWWREP